MDTDQIFDSSFPEILHHDVEVRPQNEASYLLGYPIISIDDHGAVHQQLTEDLWASELEYMAPHLWVMTTQSSTNIRPLHHQAVKGRDILPTETPRLHLVWVHNRIFLKPIPPYLLSPTYWQLLFPPPPRLHNPNGVLKTAALGFLRSYKHLIRHASDLRLAQSDQLQLIPPHITWAQWSAFCRQLDRITDADVSQRYTYGELRLTRLNFYIKFLMGRFEYERIETQYSEYFARFYGPMLFVVGLFAVLLNAMQVLLAAEQVDAGMVLAWPLFPASARAFGLLAIALVTFMTLGIAALWAFLFVDEWVFALKALRRRRTGRKAR